MYGENTSLSSNQEKSNCKENNDFCTKLNDVFIHGTSGVTLSNSKLSDFILEFRIGYYQTFCIRTLNFN